MGSSFCTCSATEFVASTILVADREIGCGYKNEDAGSLQERDGAEEKNKSSHILDDIISMKVATQ